MVYILGCIELIILILIIITIKSKSKQNTVTSKTEFELTQTNNYYPYEKKHLLTKSEYKFYKELKEQCKKNEYIICPKVRLEDFIKVTDSQNVMKYRGYIKSRHIDFLICDKNLYILAGIELDDNSHYQKQAQKTDDLKNNIFKAIKIPLFRIKETNNYTLQINLMMEDLEKNNQDNIIKQTK